MLVTFCQELLRFFIKTEIMFYKFALQPYVEVASNNPQ